MLKNNLDAKYTTLITFHSLKVFPDSDKCDAYTEYLQCIHTHKTFDG